MLLLMGLLLAWLNGAPADAHEILDNLVEVDAAADGALQGRWEIPLVDLEDLWPVHPQSAADRAGAALAHADDIHKAVFDDLSIALGDGSACPITFGKQEAAVHRDQPYVVLPFVGRCPAAGLRSVQVIWTFLNASEHDHKALVSFRSPGGVQAAVLSKAQPILRFGLIGRDDGAQFQMYLHDGALHIWTGLDHILFLLTLILPSVFVLRSRAWLPREHFRDTAVDVLKTVSAFTLAHSLTLALVTFHLLTVPSRLVAAVVALSVVLAGLNNVWPVVDRGRWKLALLFGLVHGIGFADVLVDLKLPLRALVNSLVGFNLGVELGQLLIVGLALPAAFLVRKTRFYRRVVFIGGSLAAAVIAALWLVGGIFHVTILPF